MTKTVEGMEKKRALAISRTETLRAHNEGALDALEDLGVTEIGVAVEWSTAKDGRVCPICAPLQGVILKTKEAHGMFPRHPNCRCVPVPANVGESTDGQVRSAKSIKQAIASSLKAGARKKDTLAQARAKSKWAGADKSISTSRPKSILDD
jgi:SPP1 gp7 family putative phage head morphogenesis protein